MRNRNLLVAALSFAALACGGSAPDRPETVGVDLVLSPTGVELAGHFDPARRILRRPRSEHRLAYEFIDERGETISGGVVDDPRTAHVEATNELGESIHVEIANQTGLLSLRLPNQSGELRIYDSQSGQAVEIARTDIPVSTAADLERARASTSRTALRADPEGNATQTWCLIDGDANICADLVVGSGDDTANVDIVLVADGFAEGDMGLFHDKARLFAERLRAVKDYGDYFHRINIWTVARPVESTGDSRYDVDVNDDGSYPQIPDSHLFSWLGFDGGLERIYHDTSFMNPDVIGVVFNTPGHGGYGRAAQWGGGATPIFTVGVSDATAHATVPHELGHALFALGDEYAGTSCSNGRQYPNIARDLGDLPWSEMLNTAVPTVEAHTYPCNDTSVADGDNCPYRERDMFEPSYVSEHDGLVGAYEGGAGCDVDRFRPSLHCMMGNHYGGFNEGDEYRDPSGEIPGSKFCPVCRREMDRYFEDIENSLGDSCPETWRDDGICDGCLGDDPDCCGFDVGCWLERLGCADGSCAAADAECGDGVCDYDENPSSCARDCGCAAIDADQHDACESVAPYGCWCDPGCVAGGDCCADAGEVCGYDV